VNDKELTVRRAEIEVRLQEIRVAEAKRAWEEGYKKLRADMEIEHTKLKAAYEREVLNLEKEKAYLENARETLDRGFEQT
jgi:hypothetical protein